MSINKIISSKTTQQHLIITFFDYSKGYRYISLEEARHNVLNGDFLDYRVRESKEEATEYVDRANLAMGF